MTIANKPKKVLTVFSLVMINVIAVDNLRTLPISAEYGFSLVFFYLLAALLFFIPTALVAAELATGWPKTGGVYVWVREAFGKRCAFFVIWLQWIYNVVWYPTMMAFLAGIFAYLINPHLADNKIYMLTVIIVMFWFTTLINTLGMKASSTMSTIGAVIGNIIPMVFITVLGLMWVFLKKPEQITMSWHTLWPNLTDFKQLSFLVAVLFGLIGMELSAVHAEEVRNPQRDYPRALLYSTIIILTTLILASLAIAIVVPHSKISLVTGMFQAFAIFFNSFHLHWLIPVVVILVVIGGLSGVSTWIIGPTKGLLVASRDGSIPPLFQKLNTRGAPISLLITQAIIVTLISVIFLLMPTVASSYWILSALTAQLALIFYIFLFATAIKLRYSHPDTPRPYKIPGGKAVLWFVCLIGIITSLVVIIFGFFPPAEINVGSILRYETILIAGIALFCAAPFVIYACSKPSWAVKS